MSFHLQLLQDSALLHLRLFGEQRVHDWIGSVAATGLLPEGDENLDRFVDLSEVTLFDMGFHNMRLIARIANQPVNGNTEPRKIAFYAPGDTQFGMASMFVTLSELEPGPAVAAVFRTREAALIWLGRPMCAVRPLPLPTDIWAA
ncbi:hypothetical protein [Antarctobacter jejuensis]|uniref:hypothetical protein n=1 Tax=Antarctobacter jejuensis TaxID=1439938 RepID=UPI003FD56650